MTTPRIRDRYIHLLYWDVQASLFLSKLIKDMPRDECILSYKKLLTSCTFWWLPSFFLSIYPCQNFQFPQNTKGLEIRLQYLRANLPSNKHIMKHVCLSQMSLMHCMFVEYFPWSLKQVSWEEDSYKPSWNNWENTQAWKFKILSASLPKQSVKWMIHSLP